MNLDLLKIATIPFRLVDLDPGWSQAGIRTDNQRRRRSQAAQWSFEHGVAADGVEPAEVAGPRRHAHTGEGRAL
jgi:hypothetical protein